jgi:hypothetical protein
MQNHNAVAEFTLMRQGGTAHILDIGSMCAYREYRLMLREHRNRQ